MIFGPAQAKGSIDIVHTTKNPAGLQDEDQAHLVQCRDDRREAWYAQFVKSSNKRQCLRVALTLTKLLTQRLESFLYGATYPAYENDVPPRLVSLAEEHAP
jgi:hypothetical protein